MHIKDKDDDGDEDEQCFWGEEIEDRAFVAETRSEEFMTFSQTVSKRFKVERIRNFSRTRPKRSARTTKQHLLFKKKNKKKLLLILDYSAFKTKLELF